MVCAAGCKNRFPSELCSAGRLSHYKRFAAEIPKKAAAAGSAAVERTIPQKKPAQPPRGRLGCVLFALKAGQIRQKSAKALALWRAIQSRWWCSPLDAVSSRPAGGRWFNGFHHLAGNYGYRSIDHLLSYLVQAGSRSMPVDTRAGQRLPVVMRSSRPSSYIIP